MIVVSVLGMKKSGKTKTIEYLISGLSKEGFRVGSIKHIHHQNFSIDREGTDTWRHMQAGALITAAFSPSQTVIIKKDTVPNDINQIIKVFCEEKLDFIFIEGFHSLCSKRTDIFKILVARDLDELKRTLDGVVHPILAITGPVVREKDRVLREVNLPVIDLDSEGKILIEKLKNILKREED